MYTISHCGCDVYATVHDAVLNVLCDYRTNDFEIGLVVDGIIDAIRTGVVDAADELFMDRSALLERVLGGRVEASTPPPCQTES